MANQRAKSSLSVSSEEEGDDGRQESCMKSTISEAEVRSRLEDVRSYFITDFQGRQP